MHQQDRKRVLQFVQRRTLWLYVSMQQQQRTQVGSVRLYPVQLPEQHIDWVTFQPSTKLLRIEE